VSKNRGDIEKKETMGQGGLWDSVTADEKEALPPLGRKMKKKVSGKERKRGPLNMGLRQKKKNRPREESWRGQG